MHAIYVKISKQLLAGVPYDLLHGAVCDGQRINLIDQEPEAYRLRKDQVRLAVYGLSKSGSTDWQSFAESQRAALIGRARPSIPEHEDQNELDIRD